MNKATMRTFWKEESRESAHKDIKKQLEKAGGKKKDPKPAKKTSKTKSIVKDKMHKVMDEYKTGILHSGSKKGPQVKSRKQAIAIGLSEARKRGAKIPKKKK